MAYTNQTFYDAVGGDAASINATIKQFTPLVHKWARKYKFMGHDHSYEDLVQEGYIGLLEAIRTFDLDLKVNGKNLSPMTWIWWKVRAAVQGTARKENKLPKYPLSLENSDWGNNLEDPCTYEVRDERLPLTIEEIVRCGCGSLDNTRAKIVKDRFGLLGSKPMRQGEVAAKYGLSKQATNGHIARFSKAVREKHPELKEFI